MTERLDYTRAEVLTHFEIVDNCVEYFGVFFHLIIIIIIL